MSINQILNIRFMAFIIGIILFIGGIFLSVHKPLWNDEFFTQSYSVEGHSYGQILMMDFPKDGNHAPFYYLLQKGLTSLVHYKLPFAYTPEVPNVFDIKGQIVLRLLSNIFMTLSVVSLFLFLANRFGRRWGMVGIVLMMAHQMTWSFWVEARPYSLWYLLTLWQVMLAYKVYETKDQPQCIQSLRLLAVTHVLLPLTIASSILTIMPVSFMLLIGVPILRKHWGFISTIIILPIMLVLMVMSKGLINEAHAYFAYQHFIDNVPLHWLIFFLVICMWQACIRNFKNEFMMISGVFIGCMLLACLVLWRYSQTDVIQGFYSRYLIFLVPIQVLIITLAIKLIFDKIRPYPWLVLNLIILVLGIVSVQAHITFLSIYVQATYLHSPI